MCLAGHIVDQLEIYKLDERLLVLPEKDTFQILEGDLERLEGCYLYFNDEKSKWIRSGKTSGDGDDACFLGRGKTHKKMPRRRIKCGSTCCIQSIQHQGWKTLETVKDVLTV